MAVDWKNMDVKDLLKLIKTGKVETGPELMTESTGKYEINLLPDIKTDAIRMQKIRNLALFICLVAVGVSTGAVVVFGGIKSGQDLIMSAQDKKIDKMSSKMANYKELTEFLTIQGQLNKLSELSEKRRVMSRIFDVLPAVVPTDGDKIQISELKLDMDAGAVTMEGQADAGKAPFIDYRVLESFKKTLSLAKIDYGRYVDKKGKEIPTRCIEEKDQNGDFYHENGKIYAIWHRGKKGCDPSRDDLKNKYSDEALKDMYANERIWRTPKFNDWYKQKTEETAGDGIDDREGVKDQKYKPQMSLDGEISGVPHFNSQCIKYSGELNGKKPKWKMENNCNLVNNEMRITDSSNGRDNSDQLVLRFTGMVEMNTETFAYKNKHMMTIGPNGQNVTDSYKQVEGMFTKKAADCASGDAACRSKQNKVGDK